MGLRTGYLMQDHLRLQTTTFKGKAHLAWQARDLFLHTPGIASFEVSPYSGDVYIGFDDRALKSETNCKLVFKLLRDYFPELVEAPRFKRIYRCLN